MPEVLTFHELNMGEAPMLTDPRRSDLTGIDRGRMVENQYFVMVDAATLFAEFNGSDRAQFSAGNAGAPDLFTVAFAINAKAEPVRLTPICERDEHHALSAEHLGDRLLNDFVAPVGDTRLTLSAWQTKITPITGIEANGH